MDWIEQFFGVSPDGGDGWLQWLYIILPLSGFCFGSLSVLWFWHHHQHQRKKVKRILLAPDELGLAKLELGKLRVEDETEIPFAFDVDLMTRLKLAAEKRKMSPGDLLAKAVVRAFENPAVLSEIERRHVRRR
jgi:hypothetical protein